MGRQGEVRIRNDRRSVDEPVQVRDGGALRPTLPPSLRHRIRSVESTVRTDGHLKEASGREGVQRLKALLPGALPAEPPEEVSVRGVRPRRIERRGSAVLCSQSERGVEPLCRGRSGLGRRRSCAGVGRSHRTKSGARFRCCGRSASGDPVNAERRSESASRCGQRSSSSLRRRMTSLRCSVEAAVWAFPLARLKRRCRRAEERKNQGATVSCDPRLPDRIHQDCLGCATPSGRACVRGRSTSRSTVVRWVSS